MNDIDSKMSFATTLLFTIFLVTIINMSTVNATIENIPYLDTNSEDNILYKYYISKISLNENK